MNLGGIDWICAVWVPMASIAPFGLFTHRLTVAMRRLLQRFIGYVGAHNAQHVDAHERDRARQRAMISLAFSAITGWDAWHSPAPPPVEVLVPVLSLAYALVALLHLKVVLARQRAGVLSQYLFIVLDSMVTVVAFVGAPAVLGPLYPVLMVQIVRCGMRYGLRTLWLSWAAAALAALALMPLSDYWTGQVLLLRSFVAMMVVIPLLFAPLVRTLHRVTAELRIAAGSDPLTGLSNRRLLDEHIRLARERCERERSMLAVMLVDLDNFKVVNDTFGHAVGDQLLERVALAIQRCCRDGDFLARVGGDEFVLLVAGLPEQVGRERAKAIADKVVAVVQAAADELVPAAGVSASAGVYCWMGGVAQAEATGDLVEQADRAMYLAKRAGKSRVEMAG